MTLEKESLGLIIGVYLLAFIYLISGFVGFSLDYSGWFYPILLTSGALVLFFELEFKKANFIPIHNLKKWGTMQYLSFVVSISAILTGILNIPTLHVAIVSSNWFTQISAFLSIFIALFIILEWNTNKR